MSKPSVKLKSPLSDHSTDSSSPQAREGVRFWSALASAPLPLLALLLASVAARHSEVWLHLAAGRGLLSGSYRLGTDPFAYTTAGATWVNHAWLYDWALYLAHLVCGQQLVVCNAILATVLALFMLLGAGWPRAVWTSLLSVALALVCIGPSLVLLPTMISYLCLAFTLWWLVRSDQDSATSWSVRRQIPLLAVQLVWVNCDEWFWLGPLTIGLYWLGSAARPAPRIGWQVVASSLAVCLLNPHHVHVFQIPSDLTDSPISLSGATTTIEQFQRLSWPNVPVPLVAYVLLAALSLFALVTNRTLRSVPLALLWFVLFGLSLYRMSAIPFFAIAASQTLSIHWQAARERRASSGPSQSGADWTSRRSAWLEPAIASLTGWVLVLLSLPGWLQNEVQPRSWLLLPDPSMQRLAERLAERHERGELSATSRGFNLSPAMAHYVEWFCPQEKVFFDGRAHLYAASVVEQFQKAGQGLAPESSAAPSASDARDAAAVLDQWQCTHLLAADPVDRRIAAALKNLWQRPAEWKLIDLDGRAALFVWQQASDNSIKNLAGIDFNQLAFAASYADKAPRNGIEHEPHPRLWWRVWDWSAAQGELERDEAAVHLVYFESQRRNQFEQDWKARFSEAAAVLLAAAGPHNAATPSVAGLRPLDSLLALSELAAGKGETPLNEYALQRLNASKENSDQGPPGSVLLAVRSARRSLHDNADDALAHLRAGRACNFLQRQTMERGVSGQFPLLEQLRTVQAMAALKRAARLQPDLQPAHELLAELCLQSRSYDLALPHVQQQLRLSKAAGPAAGESTEEFNARIERLTAFEQQLGKQVRDLLNLADTQTFEMGTFAKARHAESNGLPGYALEQLLHSSYAEFGREGAILELYLLLHAGRTDDFRGLVDPAYEAVLGPFNYHWMQTLLAAGDGNYDDADEHLQQLVTAETDSLVRRSPGRSNAVLDGMQVFLGSSNNPWQWLFQMRNSSRIAQPAAAAMPAELRQQVDLLCVRGMLALESGEVVAARSAFTAGLKIWNGEGGSAALARHYLRLTDPQ